MFWGVGPAQLKYPTLHTHRADGGGLYTNAPCPGCHVSRNYFADDPAAYGCLYHDGGSGSTPLGDIRLTYTYAIVS